jgi:GMP synthase (glutamine-hydrolysing)
MTVIDLSTSKAATRRRAAATGAPAGGAPRDVLVIVHRPDSNPGRVGQWLRANGYRLDIRCPREGGSLPETLGDHAGVVMFGGPMSANDPDDYIKQEIDWLAVPLHEEKPYFGICLGAQMLAKQLGSRVGFHPEGQVEIGYYPIDPTEAGRDLLAWPGYVYHWHCEGFELPAGAECLVRGTSFENQALRYGSAFGVQFHPEMTLAMINRWTTVGAPRLVLPGALPRHEHIAGHDRHGAHTRRWLDAFMPLWLASGAAGELRAKPAKPLAAVGVGQNGLSALL